VIEEDTCQKNYKKFIDLDFRFKNKIRTGSCSAAYLLNRTAFRAFLKLKKG
jgi:hypothetical protein